MRQDQRRCRTRGVIYASANLCATRQLARYICWNAIYMRCPSRIGLFVITARDTLFDSCRRWLLRHSIPPATRRTECGVHLKWTTFVCCVVCDMWTVVKGGVWGWCSISTYTKGDSDKYKINICARVAHMARVMWHRTLYDAMFGFAKKSHVA